MLIACYLVILMLCLGLTLDLGNTYLLHLKMRNAADLAAASIGAKLPEENTDQNAEELCALAERIVEDNGIDLSTTAINCEILREDKINYCFGPEYVLIDDYTKNGLEWKQKGGTVINHSSSEDTLEQLKDLGIL